MPTHATTDTGNAIWRRRRRDRVWAWAAVLGLAAAVVGAVILITRPAASQTVCAPRQPLVDGLASKFGEVPTARGLGANAVVEVLAAPDGQWTILVTQPNGLACVVMTGRHWQPLPPALVGDPS